MIRKTLLTSACLLALCTAAPAQDETAPDDAEKLMERGAQMLLRGMLQRVEPTLDDLRDLAEGAGPGLRQFAAEMGPAFRDLLEEIEDWSAYHPPEILDNGDIIIRRKPVEEDAPNTLEGESEIEI